MITLSTNRYKNYRSPAEIISHGVWLYFRFCLSYRDVEELLFTRGAIVSYEAICKGCQYVPRVLITDQLKSYGVAMREILPNVEHRQHRYINNRAENSHPPTRQRERRMQGFKPPEHAQRFLSAYGPIAQHSRNATQIRHLAETHNPPHRRISVKTGGRHVPSCLVIMLASNKLTKPAWAVLKKDQPFDPYYVRG